MAAAPHDSAAQQQHETEMDLTSADRFEAYGEQLADVIRKHKDRSLLRTESNGNSMVLEDLNTILDAYNGEVNRRQCLLKVLSESADEAFFFYNWHPQHKGYERLQSPDRVVAHGFDQIVTQAQKDVINRSLSLLNRREASDDHHFKSNLEHLVRLSKSHQNYMRFLDHLVSGEVIQIDELLKKHGEVDRWTQDSCGRKPVSLRYFTRFKKKYPKYLTEYARRLLVFIGSWTEKIASEKPTIGRAEEEPETLLYNLFTSSFGQILIGDTD